MAGHRAAKRNAAERIHDDLLAVLMVRAGLLSDPGRGGAGRPADVVNLRNQRFNATLGQRQLNRSSERHQRATDEMFVYRFDGWLHAARAGRYELGFEVTCGFEHPCNLVVKLGGQQLVSSRGRKFNNTLLQTGIDLEAGERAIRSR